MTLPATFTSKTRPSDCVIWTGALNSKGYGCYSVAGSSQLAHRVAYEDVRGPIPDGLTVDHLCRVRQCVNPEHMELVTRSENIRRARSPLTVGSVCTRGHVLTQASLYVRADGNTECRECCADRRAAA